MKRPLGRWTWDRELKPVRQPLERPLDAAWQSTQDIETVVWRFQLPTRVDGFEFREPIGGEVLSIVVGLEEQVMGPFALVGAAQFLPRGSLVSSPAEGWKLGPIALPAFGPGTELQIRLARFAGLVRPFGVQLGGGPRDPGAPELGSGHGGTR